MNEGTKFTDQELALLERIAGWIIPAAPESGLPGGDDQQILHCLIERAEKQAETLRGALQDLLNDEGGVMLFSTCEQERFERWMTAWAEGWPARSHAFFKSFLPLLLRTYYQDPRVHEAHGRRPGPPFPDGYDVMDGDWSLLDQVRDRPAFYRREDSEQ